MEKVNVNLSKLHNKLGEVALFWVKFDYFRRKNVKMNSDPTLNITTICRYLSRSSSIFLFLAFSLLFAVVLVVFIQPVGVLSNTTQLSSMSPVAQLALITVAGYLTVLISRVVLHLVARRHTLSPMVYAIWIAIELMFCVAFSSFFAWIVSGCGSVKIGPLAGDIFLGNIAVFLIPNIIAFQDFRIHELKAELRRSQAPSQTVPISPSLPDQHINFYEKGGRLALTTRCSNVLYIEAADNYANIHYINEGKEDAFILHNTLKDIEKDCLAMGLLRCHRGYMVNVENVKLMRKERGNLLLEINHTPKIIPVSKSYASDVINFFSTNNASAPLSGPIPVL